MTGRPRQTHCQRGHEFTPENERRNKKGRCCKTCANASFKIRYNASEELRQKMSEKKKRIRQERIKRMETIIDYTNWRGERRERTVTPISIVFGPTEWHPEPQWLLEAIDSEKGLRRFAMANIHSWRKA